MMRLYGVAIFATLAWTAIALPQKGMPTIQQSFRFQRSEVIGLKREASQASSVRRREILQRLMNVAIADVDKLIGLKILNNADESDLATAIFALQPVVLEAIEQVAALESRTARVASHAIRALRILSAETVRSNVKTGSKAEVIAWARAQQKVHPKVRQELVKANEALKKGS